MSRPADVHELSFCVMDSVVGNFKYSLCFIKSAFVFFRPFLILLWYLRCMQPYSSVIIEHRHELNPSPLHTAVHLCTMSDPTLQSQSSIYRKSSESASFQRIASPFAVIKYAQQAEKLSYLAQPPDDSKAGSAAVRVAWITPQDPIIVTSDGGRLPEVPVDEAIKLNNLRAEIGAGEAEDAKDSDILVTEGERLTSVAGGEGIQIGTENSTGSRRKWEKSLQKSAKGSLQRAMPPSRTHPLFPPLPLYGPPSTLRNIQCMIFRITSAVLSLAFLAVIVLGSAFTSIPLMFNHIWLRMTFRNPDSRRPFHAEEVRRQKTRKQQENEWKKKRSRRLSNASKIDEEFEANENDGYTPTEGGSDPLVCDVGYYARRVGLDVEELKVQTEDGFIITLWHVYNPREFTPMKPEERQARGPDIFTNAGPSRKDESKAKKKFPVLMIHGLLQSSGAYCTNDDDSLAFYLCKQGYDVWLGNNRCGFNPEHTLLSYSDPRMWAWNIRQMGVLDLPAFVSRILSETGFEKLGLICHSQGTTQTFVALAKEQRPDLGDKITVFCALAPAVYAGPLIGKMYFKFMRVISPAFFRIFFGIHAFIPFMMTMHRCLPGKLYGAMGYRVFSFLFNWSDDRWERGLRDRMFQFAPVYVSAESMRWWLGRECFAKQKCILATKEEVKQEDAEDRLEDYYEKVKEGNITGDGTAGKAIAKDSRQQHKKKPKGSTAWYDEHAPPFALWVCGSDDLVDGRRLLRRFERGREPHVKLVHKKIIEEYEHLDVIWAMDMIEKVGKEVKEVLWKTCDVRERCIMPKGCDEVEPWIQEKVDNIGGEDADEDEEDQSGSAEERRLTEKKETRSRRFSVGSIFASSRRVV
jgi:pimeloyl-ACP methyl ester carboxylesterase